MRLSRVQVVLTVALLTSLSFTFAQAGEKRISRSELPPAVQKTVNSEAINATVKGFSKEVEKGQTFYEVELIANRHSKNILIDANGKVVEVEEEIPINTLPSQVKKGLEAKSGTGKIVKVEALTKNGKLVAYEAQVTTKGSKKSEIQVGPEGQALGHEE